MLPSISIAIVIHCPLPSVSNGSIHNDGGRTAYTPGESVTFTCNQGYKAPDSTTTCQASESWDPQPSCTVVECEIPRLQNGYYLRNGQAVSHSQVYGSVIEPQCSKGYMLSNAFYKTCTESGMWFGLGLQPSCTVVSCSIPHLPNGHYLHNGYPAGHSQTYGQIIEPQCSEGYTLSSVIHRNCTHSGKWSGFDPACEAIKCDTLPYVENGHYDVGGHVSPFIYDHTVSLACDYGFKTNGTNNVRKCIFPDTWSGEYTTCIRITCRQPDAYAHGTYNTSENSYDFESIILPTCHNGFYMKNNVTKRVCIDMNKWSDSEPLCEIVQCQPPMDANGSVVSSANIYIYNTSITIRCNAGFEIKDGLYTRTCNERGTWDPNASHCERTGCNDLVDVGHETVIAFPQRLMFGDKGNVTYNANFFYLTRGSTEVICSSDKTLTWTNAPYFGMINDWFFSKYNFYLRNI